MKLGDWDTYQEELGVAVANSDPTALLMAEHNWLRSVLADVEKVLHADAETALAGLGSEPQEVAAFIDLHIRKEEQFYFPVLEPQLAAEGLGVDFQSLYAEHDQIQGWLGHLLDALISSKDVLTTFHNFQNALAGHFNNEEELVFERAPAMLTPEVARQLVEKIRRLTKTDKADNLGEVQMQQEKKPTYLRTHRLRAKALQFILGAEDEELRERAESSKAGRAAKTLVKEGPLRVTLVALTKGTALQSHQVANPVTIQSVRGCLKVTTEAEDLDVPAGNLVVLDAGVAHTAKALDDCAVLITVTMG